MQDGLRTTNGQEDVAALFSNGDNVFALDILQLDWERLRHIERPRIHINCGSSGDRRANHFRDASHP